MSKIGRFVTDPKAGAYCQIALDSGERILVNHDRGGFKGGHVTITTVKWLGFAAGETLLDLDLDGAAGRAALARLTAGAAPGSVGATPLGAVVEYVKACRSSEEVRARVAGLAS